MLQQEVLQTNFDTDEFLAHHGILGQKWGIRRYQNEDGSLTSAGKERYGLSKKEKIALGKDIEDKVIEKSLREGKSYKETKEEIKKYCEDNIEKLESYDAYKKSQMMQRGINTVAMLIPGLPGLAASLYGSDNYSTALGPNGLGVADIFKSNTKRKYDYFKKHMSQDAFDTEEFLEHHGILGQKWGIRRYQNPDGSLTPEGRKRYGLDVGKGTVVSRISTYAGGKDPADKSGRTYVSTNEDDADYYKSTYVNFLKGTAGANAKIYNNTYVAAVDLKSPDKKERKEIVDTIVKTNEKAVRELGEQLVKQRIFNAAYQSDHSSEKLTIDSAVANYKKQYPEEYKKLTESFVNQLLEKSKSTKQEDEDLVFDKFRSCITMNPKLFNLYKEEVKKRGYNCVIDDEDAGRVSISPMIVFDPEKNLKLEKSEELTDQDIRKARINFNVNYDKRKKDLKGEGYWDSMDEEEFLAHHGILGMKWGIRRYQNPDGSLTPAGRERYAKKAKIESKESAARDILSDSSPTNRNRLKKAMAEDYLHTLTQDGDIYDYMDYRDGINSKDDERKLSKEKSEDYIINLFKRNHNDVYNKIVSDQDTSIKEAISSGDSQLMIEIIEGAAKYSPELMDIYVNKLRELEDLRQDAFDTDEFLAHHGILGMKWGIRRYQNPDGSLTEAGKRKYGNARKAYNVKTPKEAYKKRAKYTDEEMVQILKRFTTEQKLDELSKKYRTNRKVKWDTVVAAAGGVYAFTQSKAGKKLISYAKQIIDDEMNYEYDVKPTKTFTKAGEDMVNNVFLPALIN